MKVKNFIKFVCFIIGMILVSAMVLAEPDSFGRAVGENPDIVIENIRWSNPLSQALAVYGLEQNYPQGGIVRATCDEKILKPCIGEYNAVLVTEFYNADKDHQTVSSYVAGSRTKFPYSGWFDPEDVGGSISYDVNYQLSSTAKVGTWSLSCYLSCNSPSMVIGSVDEENFEVQSVCYATNLKSVSYCYNNNPWWYDNCGKRTTQRDACGENTKCQGGACVPTCSGTKKNKVCKDNRLIWTDECGREVEMIQSCVCEGNVCKQEVKQCSNVPVKPCDKAVWNDYPYCEWDESGCLDDNGKCSLNSECPPDYVCLNAKCSPSGGGEVVSYGIVIPIILTIGGLVAGFYISPFAFIISGVGVIWLIIQIV